MEPSRPRGRPKLKDEDRRSEPVGVRLTPAIRKHLVEASRDGGRTLSQEIELRLRRSFDFDNEIMKKFGSPGTYAFVRMVADGINTVELLSSTADERRWLDDRFTFDQVTAMINEMLSYLRPTGRSVKPKPRDKWDNPDTIGKSWAGALVFALARAVEVPEAARHMLGEATANMLAAAAVPLLRRFKRSGAAMKGFGGS
jgi:hypothetical protein